MSKLINNLSEQKEILESQGYSVAYICIYGSQNYNLDIHTDDYQSDIDMKAIIVPTLDDLIQDSKPVSTVVDTEWGQCDIKDIRLYFKTLLKANPAYIETLYTDYYVVDSKFDNEFEQIFNLRDNLVETLKAQMIRAMYGMMKEKEKAMCHPYPTIAHKIEKYKFDGKQTHHILRLWLMMEDYYNHGKNMKECMYPDAKLTELLIDHKLNKLPFETALEDVNDVMKLAKEFKDEVLNNIDENKVDYSVKGDFLKLSQEIIKSRIIEESKGVQYD
ncbi:hypothetical protein CIL05_07565 [Virgibacillus profundi]|uniref:Nucleotidyltransferase n=1 Tax=Virgibacillus profundi TaxID=2024555 RepID=A0A2A2IEZ4_9BACI|nr:nucleotidyltransferase domain-containing protein [Virgibacillus profundi]PAV30319.1 hypothetical protein CIL05_07565 [Virgibacillus profundi]PXY54491.1 hypothetical protein CIT14_07650 [Virgibacillus profundi]